MAHEIANINGIDLFMSYGTAWHGKGIVRDSLFSRADVIESGIVPTIEHRQVTAIVGGASVIVPDVNAIIVSVAGQESVLGSCMASDARPIIQPSDWLEMLEAVFSKFGAKFSSVGSLYNGETFFVSAQMQGGYQIMGDDHIWHLNALDNFSGKTRARFFGSSIRQVCENTAKEAWSEGFEKVSFIHRGKDEMKNRVNDAMASFEAIILNHPKNVELLRQSTQIGINPVVAIDSVLDACLGAPGLNINIRSQEAKTPSKTALDRCSLLGLSDSDSVAKMQTLVGKQIIKRQSVIDAILENYHSETCATARGSVYSAYQAVTEYANYGIASKKTDRQSGNDFLSLANGKGAYLTNAAWSNLIALAV